MNEHSIYQALKLYNDFKAVRSGSAKKVTNRLERRLLGKVFGKAIGRMVR